MVDLVSPLVSPRVKRSPLLVVPVGFVVLSFPCSVRISEALTVLSTTDSVLRLALGEADLIVTYLPEDASVKQLSLTVLLMCQGSREFHPREDK